jgi:hypothetical protein
MFGDYKNIPVVCSMNFKKIKNRFNWSEMSAELKIGRSRLVRILSGEADADEKEADDIVKYFAETFDFARVTKRGLMK